MNVITRYVSVGVLAVSMGMASSCSMWDILKPSSPGLAVDTELVIGDKHQTVETRIGETNNKADSIIQNIDEVDYVMMGALVTSVAAGVVGWMLPVPGFIRRRTKQQES